MDLFHNWLLMALLTPTFWALGCLLDSYMIGDRIYRSPIDGVVVSCLFCLVPALLALSLTASSDAATFQNKDLPFVAVAAGIAYVFHLLFYFRTLFCLNDVSGAETFLSLSVLIVPFFAWLLLAEVLPARFYLAFIVAAAGILLQCLPLIRQVGTALLVNMIVSVVAVSLSMVLQSHALQTHGFIRSTLTFNLTGFLVAGAVMTFNARTRKRVTRLLRHFPLLLVAGEVLGALAVLSSHRATEQGPSVSMVALVECLLPVFILGFSLALMSLSRYTPLIDSKHYKTFARQVQETPAKVGAIALLMISFSSVLI